MPSLTGKRLMERAYDVILDGHIQLRTTNTQSSMRVLSQANVDLSLGGPLNHCHRLRYGVGTYAAKVYPGGQQVIHQDSSEAEVIEKPKQLPLSVNEPSLVTTPTKPPSTPDTNQQPSSIGQPGGSKGRNKNKRKKRKKRKRR